MVKRTDITEEKLAEVLVAYGPESTVGEIIVGIKKMRASGRKVSDNASLREATERVLAERGKSVRSFDNWEEVVKFLEDQGAQVAQEEEEFLENKALTSEELKVLLDEYDRHRDEKDLQKMAEEIKKNPLLQRSNIREIVRMLERKRELEVNEEKLSGNRVKADEVSDQKIILESRLEEQGIERDKAVKLSETIVENIKQDRTISIDTAREVINSGERLVVKEEQNRQTEEVLRLARVTAYEERLRSVVKQIAREATERIVPEEIVYTEEGTAQAAKEAPREFLARVERVQAVVEKQLTEALIGGETGTESMAAAGARVATEAREIGQADEIKIAMTEAGKKIAILVERNEEQVEAVRIQDNFDKLRKDTAAANPEMSPVQTAAAREFVREVATLPQSGVEQHKEAAVAGVVGEVNDQGVKLTKTQAEANFRYFKTALEMARGGEEKINKLLTAKDKLEKLGIKIPIKNDKIRAVDSVLAVARKDPGFAKLMATVGKKVEIFNNFYNGLGYRVFAKIGGEKAVTWLAGKIGGQAGKVLATEGLKIVAKKGFEAGLKNVLGQIAVKAGIQVSSKVAGGVAAKAVGILAGTTNPIGWAILAAGLVKDFVAGAFKRSAQAVDKLARFLGFEPAKLKADLEDNFGKLGGALAYYGGAALTLLVGLPTLIGAAMITTIIGPIIIFLFVGIMAYQLIIQGPMISSIKPPEGMGGGQCVLKSEADNLGGAINCNMSAPENSFSGINKAKFVGVANAWVASGGKNWSEECYNDVVNRALCAGINPAYALWAWAHESGASNYSIADVEDFGIHYIGKPKDFNAQITEFLTLDPGAYCLGAPKIGSNYWLGFSTNYLNGSCDPDEPNPVSGQTGRQYLEDLKKSWSFVSSEPLPNDIHVSPGGVGCGDPGTTEGSNAYEYVDAQGNTWICQDNTVGNMGMIPNFEPWDPSTPVPEGCPSGLPIHAGYFSQGPFAPGCSHQAMVAPAIDIAVGLGTEIRATHTGVVSQNYDPIYGFYIDLHGKCGGADFFTRYAHMPSGGFRTANGVTVEAGEVIGVVDTTGSSTGNHLHFHITGLDTNKFGQYLGLTVTETQQLWACCNGDNGKYCPALK